MDYTWKKAKLYANKITGGGDTIDETLVNVTNENCVSENIAVPEIYIDYNNCGEIVFVTVRPFHNIEIASHQQMCLIKESGTGIFYLPIPHFNHMIYHRN